MRYMIVGGNTPSTKNQKHMFVPNRGKAYDYSFLPAALKQGVVAMHVPADRQVENIRRSVQTAVRGVRTSVVDNVLLVW